MSIGNLKDSGNQGNNFPYQLAVLKGLSISQCKNLTEYYFEEGNSADLANAIQTLFNQNPDKYLISKTTDITSTGDYRAFITLASI
jgi:hypothetical protein